MQKREVILNGHGYDLFLSFILLLKLFQVFPVGPASGWLLCYLSLSLLLSLPYFLGNNMISGLLFCFPTPAVESNASQYETLDSFFFFF